jgi:hypothetical protein
MEALLKSDAATVGGSSAGNVSSAPSGAEDTDTVMWGRVFAQQQNKALFLLLDQLNVAPLVEYRVARLLLLDPSPIGIHVIANARVSRSPRCCSGV